MTDGAGGGIGRALVLSGGGARGAYEVGVLRYVLEDLVADLGAPPRFDIISGTSVGAVNGCFLAVHADRPDYAINRLVELWRGLRVADYLHLDYRELLHVGASLLGLGGRFVRPNGDRPYSGGRLGGLLNTSSLDRLVRDQLLPGRIGRNVRAGHLRAVTVGVTEVATGRTMTFVELDGDLPRWTRDPREVARRTQLGAEQALASASIPFLFPAVLIDGRYYCDGGLRQNTPLSPALRLGATRVLVISLRHERQQPDAVGPVRELAYPNALFLFGKLLNALLLDPIGYDLSVLERTNQILRHGRAVYGATFEEELSRAVTPLRGKAYRIVDDILVRPSEDIGRVAGDLAGSLHAKDWGGGPAAHLLRRLGGVEVGVESDLLSYLLFDGQYAERLMEMGRRDAAAHHDELVAFFGEGPYPY